MHEGRAEMVTYGSLPSIWADQNSSVDGIADSESPIVCEVLDVDHLAALGPLWDEFGFSEVIDASVPNDPQVALRTSTVLKAMALNIVGGRDPLYRVSQAWENRPIEHVLGEGVTPESLNDSSLARHLDRFSAADCESVFNALSLRVIDHEGLSLSRLQADTTSRLVFGEYRNPEADAISITHGHSKDHRPDLKQVMAGVCSTTDGVPVIAQMLDGNTSDKKWHGGMLDLVRSRLQLPEDQQVHYVGDSALITENNLNLAKRHRIVISGRLPRTVSACDSVVSEVLKNPEMFEELGTFSDTKGAAFYRGRVVRREVLGHEVQLGVYTTDAKDARVTKNVDRRQDKALKIAEKEARKRMRTSFACAPDAELAGREFAKAFADPLIHITWCFESEQRLRPLKRGRPSKGTVRQTYEVYRLKIFVNPNDDERALQIERGGTFVLLHSGDDVISAHDLLRVYKDQSVVETRFPFLKDAAWADVFFIKTPHRLEALGYVILIALLLWSLWERRVRKNLEASKEPPLRDTTGMKKKRPTATVCRHVLQNIKIIRIRKGDRISPWRLVAPPNDEQMRVLRFSAPASDQEPHMLSGLSLILGINQPLAISG